MNLQQILGGPEQLMVMVCSEPKLMFQQRTASSQALSAFSLPLSSDYETLTECEHDTPSDTHNRSKPQFKIF